MAWGKYRQAPDAEDTSQTCLSVSVSLPLPPAQIRIVKGDLQNLTARVTGMSADGTKVSAMPDIKGFSEEVEFELDEVVKIFTVRVGGRCALQLFSPWRGLHL